MGRFVDLHCPRGPHCAKDSRNGVPAVPAVVTREVQPTDEAGVVRRAVALERLPQR